MVNIKVFKDYNGEDSELVNTFSKGEHIIGRGPVLQCDDVKVSRQHAVINVGDSQVFLRATHINPCFYKSLSNINEAIKLEKDDTQELNDGDQFSLATNSQWYKVQIEIEEPNLDLNPSNSCKRELEDSEEIAAKKLRVVPTLEETELSDTHDGGRNEEENREDCNSEIVSDLANCHTEETNVTVKEQNESCDGGTSNPIKKEENDDEKGQMTSNQPSTSTKDADKPTTSNRDQCWYGDRCYRKNPIHRHDFSHPGDPDFDSNRSDDREVCPYGPHCYRRNSEHRNKYKHDNPPMPRTTGRKKRKASRNRRNYAESDSDSEYFSGGSSDNYTYSGNSDGSTTEDSDEEEESQNRERTLQEAKKFIQKKSP